MTLAIIISTAAATDAPVVGVAPDGARRRAVDRIRAQLAEAGSPAVHVVDLTADADVTALAHVVEGAAEPVLLCAGDLVAHTEVFRQLDAGPPATSRALLIPGDAADRTGDPPPAVREQRGRIVGVTAGVGGSAVTAGVRGSAVGVGASAVDPAGPLFGGVLRVGVPDLAALAAAVRALPGAAGPSPSPAGPSTSPAPTLDGLLTALVDADVQVGAYRIRGLVARRVTDQAARAEAEAQVRAVDPDRVRLRLAVKEHDDLFATYAVSSWSPWVTKLAARLGFSPTGVTVVSIGFAAAAATFFAIGGRPSLVFGAVLLYLGFVLDCVDGQLARYTGRFSAFGGWLDTIADRGKEYLVYAGLGIGVQQSGLGNGWALAIAAIVLQTVRHMTDSWYGALHDEAARREQATPAAPVDTARGVGDRLSQVSNRVLADPGSVVYWAKRTVVFPIGERWALIAITAALFDPLVSLVAVLIWGTLAAGYTLALRTLRAYAMRVPVLAAVDTARYRDDGFVARRWSAVDDPQRLSDATHRAAVRSAVVDLGAGQLPIALVGTLVSVTLLLVAVGPLAASGGLGTAVGGAVFVVAAGLLVATAAGAARPAAGALDWLVPAALRAAELLFVVAAGALAAVPPPVTYALLLVLALHHYDLTARLEKRLGAPPLHRWSLGWDGRVLLLTAAAIVPASLAAAVPASVGSVPATAVTATATAVLAGYLLVVFVADAVIDRRRPAATTAATATAVTATTVTATSPAATTATATAIPVPRRPADPPADASADPASRPAPTPHPAGHRAGTITGES
ncbi:DUF5941 domain-containing protein [Solwaraspora sp. WMMD406]|uniref:DUF5941 domain-containing protein n=1 Tax=Solwaraspora sp. WMMD406 TaxID=3016095 RepID=UPI00241620FD|nr:CDP-alcohol phosphatidyltransferase family protein [Solwaraspora sp. WMMD406]MDG4763488.1 DUF5941 domain-containing protein [Solwaraspora sp. WMMD406]